MCYSTKAKIEAQLGVRFDKFQVGTLQMTVIQRKALFLLSMHHDTILQSARMHLVQLKST